jgi:hypothetical protein
MTRGRESGVGDRRVLALRNRYSALAALLLALTFLFYPSEEGMAWMMWRDAPVLAAALVVGAGFFIVRWRRVQPERS